MFIEWESDWEVEQLAVYQFYLILLWDIPI